MRIVSLLLPCAVFLYTQTAFADEVLRKKISDASTSCSGDGVITKASAPAIITRCNKALNTLSSLHAASQSDEFDKRWMDFHGGATLILLAAAYTVKNDNKLNKDACQSALNADRIWSNIKVAPGSKLENDIKNDRLIHKLVPPCKKAYGIK